MKFELEKEESNNVNEERHSEPETPIEFQQFLIQPTAENYYKWITKDMVITYLDEEDMKRVRMLGEIIITLYKRGLHKNVDEFMADLCIILNSSMARHGFFTQMQRTSIGKSFQYYDETEAKKVNRGE